jgi:hypothetical protein
MAVKIKFLSVVVPIENINKSSIKGGLPGLLAQFGSSRGKSFWLDEDLYVEFAMNPVDIQAMVQRWESLGLTPRAEESGQRVWKDLCVVDFYQGPTLPCRWLTFDPNKKVVWKSGVASGAIVGPDSEGDPAPLFIPREKASEMARFATSRQAEKIERKPWWKFW